MRNPEKRKGLSGLLKNFVDKLQGKEVVKKVDTSRMSDEDFCEKVLSNIGGLENIVMADSCITRLRLEVKNLDVMKLENLEALGCEGIIKVGDNRVQMIFGEKAILLEKYYNKLKKELENLKK